MEKAEFGEGVGDEAVSFAGQLLHTDRHGARLKSSQVQEKHVGLLAGVLILHLHRCGSPKNVVRLSLITRSDP